MSTPFDDLAALNKLVHEPARLGILTALSGGEEADFLFLSNVTGLTKGNLSSHLSKLESAGLIEIRKAFEGRQPVTYVRLTDDGRDAIQEYWTRMDRVRRGARRLKPQRGRA